MKKKKREKQQQKNEKKKKAMTLWKNPIEQLLQIKLVKVIHKKENNLWQKCN